MQEVEKGISVIYGIGLCSNVYIIAGKGECMLIDSGDGSNANEIRREVAGRTIEKILLTHGHSDHVAGVWKLGVNGHLHADDCAVLEELNSLNPTRFHVGALKSLDERKVKFGDFSLEVIHTPGHTPGSVCFYEREKGVLFSGDTLFAEGVGRSDLPCGDKEALLESLKEIKKLRYKTLCPGHGEMVSGW